MATVDPKSLVGKTVKSVNAVPTHPGGIGVPIAQPIDGGHGYPKHMLCSLELEFTDGTRCVVASENGWPTLRMDPQ
jgi:hypothetical protein